MSKQAIRADIIGFTSRALVDTARFLLRYIRGYDYAHDKRIMLLWKRQGVCVETLERGEEYREKIYPRLVDKFQQGHNWVYKYRIPSGLHFDKLRGSLQDIEFDLKSEIIFKLLENDPVCHFSIKVLAGHLQDMVMFGDDTQFYKLPHNINGRACLWVPIGWSRRGLECVDFSADTSPHLLIGGGTGGGKSILGRLMLTCMHLWYSRDEVRLWLCDLKHGNGTALLGDNPLLVDRQIDHPRDVAGLMEDLAAEIERRYKLFRRFKCDDLAAYNSEYPESKLPRIVCYVDEVSKLEGKEYAYAREMMTWVTGEARGAGVHVILSCHRPTHDIISGTLKNNIPVVVAFRCNSVSAQVLLGKDDAKVAMGIDKEIPGRALFSFKDHVMVQVPYITNKMVKSIMRRYQREPEYPIDVETLPIVTSVK